MDRNGGGAHAHTMRRSADTTPVIPDPPKDCWPARAISFVACATVLTAVLIAVIVRSPEFVTCSEPSAGGIQPVAPWFTVYVALAGLLAAIIAVFVAVLSADRDRLLPLLVIGPVLSIPVALVVAAIVAFVHGPPMC